MPSKQCFEEMRFFKEVQFFLQSIHFNKKNVVIYKLVVAFERVKCIFRKRSFCDGWIFKYVLSTMCFAFSSADLPSSSFIMVTFLQADAVFFKGLILNLKLQSYLNSFV